MMGTKNHFLRFQCVVEMMGLVPTADNVNRALRWTNEYVRAHAEAEAINAIMQGASFVLVGVAKPARPPSAVDANDAMPACFTGYACVARRGPPFDFPAVRAVPQVDFDGHSADLVDAFFAAQQQR